MKGLLPTIVEDEVWRAKKSIGTARAKLMPIAFVVGSSRTELEEISKRVLVRQPDGIVYLAYHEGLKSVDLEDFQLWRL